ncbi:aminotransferase class I/II-fold pyridoxal phosphate-dependent enzyme [Aliidiomarina sp.]|uniref:aminotransferase class I/II-fold pyridoxal phosphate-dependent enzyme n=1 Tax=Aliidiomarina sp. TaxID=1872439 RepID=UPI003A4E1D0C
MPQQTIRNQLANKLAAKQERSLLRSLLARPHFGASAGLVGLNNNENTASDDIAYRNFCSNDYLGLSQHAEVIAAFQSGIQRWGVGAGASPLVTGYTEAHAALAEALAAWFGVERVILFSSGFSANAGVLHTLRAAGAVPVIDKLCHASIYDGVRGYLGGTERANKAPRGKSDFLRFLHNDYTDLQRQLDNLSFATADAREHALIVSEGLFSMDGDGADVAALVAAKQRANGLLMLDDAHGIGVMGQHYRGVFDAPNSNAIDVVTGTFGKAFGMGGAFIATDHLIADSLVNDCRHLIYSTAFPPAQAEALLAALKVMQRGELQTKLQHRIQQFRQLAAEQGLRISAAAANAPIQPIVIGGNELALRFSKALAKQGFQAIAIRPPTVPNGTARIRFTLSALHSEQAISELFAAVTDILAMDKELADACTVR